MISSLYALLTLLKKLLTEKLNPMQRKRIKTYPAYYNSVAQIPKEGGKQMRVDIKYCLFDRLFMLPTQTLDCENVVIPLN